MGYKFGLQIARDLAAIRSLWTGLKFIYSEKAAKFCEIFTVDLSYVVPVKSTVEILQNFEAFSEYMNLNSQLNLGIIIIWHPNKSKSYKSLPVAIH